MSTKSAVILVNFGGPRNLDEVAPFLTELLTDVDVIRTSFPRFFEKWFFKKVAIKRAKKVSHEYTKMGGKSPIFEDTEAVAAAVRNHTSFPVLTFHRYLPATHTSFFELLEQTEADKYLVLPLYPQFSYSTTGSIARFFSDHLPSSIVQKIHWVKSYATHPDYIEAMQNCIQDFLKTQQLNEEETFLFFSAHGLPQEFVDKGDPYEMECHRSYDAIRKAFPNALSLLAFQSRFGPGEWLRPYASDLTEEPHHWAQGRKHIVFIPLSFTSDHLETLVEIEDIYLRNVRDRGFLAYRCPALNRRPDWISTLISLLESTTHVSNHTLIRKK